MTIFLPLPPRALLVLLLCMLGWSASAGQPDALLIRGRSLVPLRYVAEMLGAEVTYQDASSPIYVRRGRDEAWVYLNRKEASVNGRKRVLDVAPMLHGGKTYVPLRFLAEALGAEVGWMPGTRRAVVRDARNRREIVLQTRPLRRRRARHSRGHHYGGSPGFTAPLPPPRRHMGGDHPGIGPRSGRNPQYPGPAG